MWVMSHKNRSYNLCHCHHQLSQYFFTAGEMQKKMSSQIIVSGIPKEGLAGLVPAFVWNGNDKLLKTCFSLTLLL